MSLKVFTAFLFSANSDVAQTKITKMAIMFEATLKSLLRNHKILTLLIVLACIKIILMVKIETEFIQSLHDH